MELTPRTHGLRSPKQSREGLTPSVAWREQTSHPLPATAVLAVVVVVAVALVVVPFFVPVTNSIWRGREDSKTCARLLIHIPLPAVCSQGTGVWPIKRSH